MKQDASIGTNILRVSASDEDADNNGAIVYSLSATDNPNDLEYFEIQPESGWIVLRKPLDVSVLVSVLCPCSRPDLIFHHQGSLLFSVTIFRLNYSNLTDDDELVVVQLLNVDLSF